MYSRSSRQILMLLLAGCVAPPMGCAKPRGELFPPIDPPRVWPGSPERARIKLIGVYATSYDLKASQSGMEVMKTALRGSRPPIRFSSPHALAIGMGQVLAVADSAGASVHVIDLDARSHVVIRGWDEERFGAPVGVAWIGPRLFVTDAQRHEVIELDASGRFHGRFGQDILARPVGIAYVEKREALYVVDGASHDLKVFDPSGSLVRTIGRRGSAPGDFNFPTHLSSHGDVLVVADSGNFRVQLLDLDGAVRIDIGHKGDAAGDFALPKGVAFDSDGHLYVSDAQFENIQVFDESGQLLLAFGEEGAAPGSFWLPAGLWIDDDDRIWVADAGNRRVQVFAYLKAGS
jgi:DNA-binding beta-propeller fold protein YncE